MATAERLAKENAAKDTKQNEAIVDLGKKLESLNFLKGLGGTLSIAQENSVWQKLVITVDSGASHSMAPPKREHRLLHWKQDGCDVRGG